MEIRRTRDSFLTATFLSEMTGKKNTVYRKRKGKPFTGVQRHVKKAKETPPVDSEIPEARCIV